MSDTANNAIDLSLVPVPAVLETLDFEAIFNEMVETVQTGVPGVFDGIPDFDGTDESDPSVKVLQVAAYYRLLDRQKKNDDARAIMVAYAEGSDLDNLGVLFRVERLTGETDASYRERIVLAPDGYSVAGPEGAYKYLARSAHVDVIDADASSPDAGEVVVTILSAQGNGAASSGLIATVTAALSGKTVRPMTDEVTVQSATIVDYAIAATLYTYAGPDKDVVMAKAQEGAQKYIAAMKRLGRDITISGVHAAIHVAGVQRAVVTSPAVDVITIADTEAGNCTGIALAWGGEAE